MTIRKLSRLNQTKLQGSDMKPVAKLGNEVKAKIGQQLRLLYDEIVDQGVPDRIAGILRDLDESEHRRNDTKKHEGPSHEPT